MTRFLVIGARGFIGHRVLHDLQAFGPAVGVSRHDVPGLQRIHTGDPAALRQAFDELQPDVVVNAAGVLMGPEDELVDANVRLVTRLLDEVVPRQLRFIHIGSAAELGNPSTSKPVREDFDCHPLSAYGRTKLEATDLVRQAHADGALVTVARVFNTVGPRQTVIQPLGDVMRQIRSLPASGGRIEVGNAEVVRDFVSVAFVARAIAALAQSDLSEPVVNVCSGQPRTVRELVAAMLRLQGVTAEIVDNSEPAIQHVVGDPSLLEKLTGLRHQPPIDELAHAVIDLDSDPTTSGSP